MKTSSGFILESLALRGPSVKEATVRFQAGLNVISGASDTGKSFVLECIDFMLGASTAPTRIPEAKAYEKATLGIRIPATGEQFSLERSLAGGDFMLASENERRILSAKHSANNPDTISSFLLNLSGLQGKTIQTNKAGKTRSLSFRDIARLVLIDEERIIFTGSPILSGQYTQKTSEKSVFSLLLSGKDAGSLIVAPGEARMSRQEQRIQIELLEQLMRELSGGSESVEVKEADAQTELEKLDAQLSKLAGEHDAAQAALDAAEGSRRETWKSLQTTESRLSVVEGLLARFALLREHYESDLQRLDAVSETGYLLSALAEKTCPLCGASPEAHAHEAVAGDFNLKTVREAVRGEAGKIHALLTDLGATTSQLSDEQKILVKEISEGRKILDSIKNVIDSELAPKFRSSAASILAIQNRRDQLVRSIALRDHLGTIQRKRTDLDAIPLQDAPAEDVLSEVRTDQAEAFCVEVEHMLKSWRFPSVGRVVFSEKDQDVVIAGQPRSSHGKGVRAVTYAAFILALMRFCRKNSLPHPGVVALDSPLVAYREPDQDSAGLVDADVKEAFFRTLSENIANGQVLIIENEDPPPDLGSFCNHIHFSKSSAGRYGFIPT